MDSSLAFILSLESSQKRLSALGDKAPKVNPLKLLFALAPENL